MTDTDSASGHAHGLWEKLARGGFAVTGLVNLILGGLILQLGASGGSEEADQQSALREIAQSTFGTLVLWLVVIAWAALAAWHVASVVRGSREWSDRADDAAKTVVYAALTFVAFGVATGGGGGSGDSQAQDYAAEFMAQPGGRWVVGLIGVGIVGAGLFHLYKGLARDFTDDLQRSPWWVVILGMIGYPAKGLALGVVGAFLGYAAYTADPDEARGMDGALESVLGWPGGPAVLLGVGGGFMAYGLYSFARARYARM